MLIKIQEENHIRTELQKLTENLIFDQKKNYNMIN